MVYNITSKGLNVVLWSQHFMLTTMSTHMRAIQHATSMRYIDIGEIFPNFMMQKSIQKKNVVVVTHIWSKDPRLEDW